MTKVVHKFTLDFALVNRLNIASDGKLIFAGVDPHGNACVWAETDDAPVATKTIEVEIFGTGYPIPLGRYHFATFVQAPFVWHVYTGQVR